METTCSPNASEANDNLATCPSLQSACSAAPCPSKVSDPCCVRRHKLKSIANDPTFTSAAERNKERGRYDDTPKTLSQFRDPWDQSRQRSQTSISTTSLHRKARGGQRSRSKSRSRRRGRPTSSLSSGASSFKSRGSSRRPRSKRSKRSRSNKSKSSSRASSKKGKQNRPRLNASKQHRTKSAGSRRKRPDSTKARSKLTLKSKKPRSRVKPKSTLWKSKSRGRRTKSRKKQSSKSNKTKSKSGTKRSKSRKAKSRSKSPKNSKPKTRSKSRKKESKSKTRSKSRKKKSKSKSRKKKSKSAKKRSKSKKKRSKTSKKKRSSKKKSKKKSKSRGRRRKQKSSRRGPANTPDPIEKCPVTMLTNMQRFNDYIFKTEIARNHPSNFKRSHSEACLESAHIQLPPRSQSISRIQFTSSTPETGQVEEVTTSEETIDASTLTEIEEAFLPVSLQSTFYDQLFVKRYVTDSLEVPSGTPDSFHLVEAECEQYKEFITYGQMVFKSKNMYTGELMAGYFSGLGSYMWLDGSYYQGGFDMGAMSGKGLHVSTDGSMYFGTYNDGERTASGVYIDSDNTAYCGEWDEELPHGKGKMWFNIKNPEIDTYTGWFRYGKFHGHGVRQYCSQDRYAGQWDTGKRSGFGTMHWHDAQQLYQGQWVDGEPGGQGILVFYKSISVGEDKTEKKLKIYLKGCFKQGRIHGPGVVYYPNGFVYKSLWNEGKDKDGQFENHLCEAVAHFECVQNLEDTHNSESELKQEFYEPLFAAFGAAIRPAFHGYLALPEETETEAQEIFQICFKYSRELKLLYNRARSLGTLWKRHKSLNLTQDSTETPEDYVCNVFGFLAFLKDSLWADFPLTEAFESACVRVPTICLDQGENPFEPLQFWQFLQCLVVVSLICNRRLKFQKRPEKPFPWEVYCKGFEVEEEVEHEETSDEEEQEQEVEVSVDATTSAEPKLPKTKKKGKGKGKPKEGKGKAKSTEGKKRVKTKKLLENTNIADESTEAEKESKLEASDDTASPADPEVPKAKKKEKRKGKSKEGKNKVKDKQPATEEGTKEEGAEEVPTEDEEEKPERETSAEASDSVEPETPKTKGKEKTTSKAKKKIKAKKPAEQNEAAKNDTEAGDGEVPQDFQPTEDATKTSKVKSKKPKSKNKKEKSKKSKSSKEKKKGKSKKSKSEKTKKKEAAQEPEAEVEEVLEDEDPMEDPDAEPEILLPLSEIFEIFLTDYLIPSLNQAIGKHLPGLGPQIPSPMCLYKAFKRVTKGSMTIKDQTSFMAGQRPIREQKSVCRNNVIYWERTLQILPDVDQDILQSASHRGDGDGPIQPELATSASGKGCKVEPSSMTDLELQLTTCDQGSGKIQVPGENFYEQLTSTDVASIMKRTLRDVVHSDGSVQLDLKMNFCDWLWSTLECYKDVMNRKDAIACFKLPEVFGMMDDSKTISPEYKNQELRCGSLGWSRVLTKQNIVELADKYLVDDKPQ